MDQENVSPSGEASEDLKEPSAETVVFYGHDTTIDNFREALSEVIGTSESREGVIDYLHRVFSKMAIPERIFRVTIEDLGPVPANGADSGRDASPAGKE